jgi:hypothetical protein
MTAAATLTATARRLPAASLRRLADAMDAESRSAWTAELLKRGHSAAELADLSGLDPAKLLVG